MVIGVGEKTKQQQPDIMYNNIDNDSKETERDNGDKDIKSDLFIRLKINSIFTIGKPIYKIK